MQYCSLQDQILLSSPDTSTTEHHFSFGPTTSFFLGLLIVPHSFPVAYWTPSILGDSSFNIISFCPFIQFMRFSQQVYRGGLPLPSPVDHVLSELSAKTHPSWMTLHGMAHSFIELCRPLCHDKEVIHEGDPTLSSSYLVPWHTLLLNYFSLWLLVVFYIFEIWTLCWLYIFRIV